MVSAAGDRSPLSVPLNELDEIMGGSESGDDNYSNPQDTSLRIGRRIKTEYALSSVFSHAVAMAHLQGDIVIHGMAEVDRPASSWLTLEWVGVSSPARTLGVTAKVNTRRITGAPVNENVQASSFNIPSLGDPT